MGCGDLCHSSGMRPDGFLLVDANNFYVSCERVFNPSLRHRPVVVLSNNEGCIVSRSNEVKAMGVPMAAPYFQHRSALQSSVILSSNYTLYADMSERMMSILKDEFSAVEVYSIDEAFIRFHQDEAMAYAMKMRIHQWIGIPTSWGFGPTKTLAKLANRLAKKQGGVHFWRDEDLSLLAQCPLEMAWGIGSGLSDRLSSLGLRTLMDVYQADVPWIRSHCGVMGARLVYELRGTPCFALEETPQKKKGIRVSRTLRHPSNDFALMSQFLATYVARACEKLRSEGLVAQEVRIDLLSHQGRDVKSMRLISPSMHTPDFLQSARILLRSLYRSHVGYKKIGVMLLELSPVAYQQSSLLKMPTKKGVQMVDQINEKMGPGALRYASEGQRRLHHPGHRSPRYTTHWQELMCVK